MQHGLGDTERLQTGCRESDLDDFIARLLCAIGTVQIAKAGRRETAQPLPRGARVIDAQQHVASALERVETGPHQRLDVVDVDLRPYRGLCAHISATQRRISWSLIVVFSKPLRMRLLRARSCAVSPG